MMQIVKVLIVFAATALFATAVAALDLQTGKQKQLVGEKSNGYIGAVVPSSEVNALVVSVNAQRKSAYMAIARENQQPLNVVEALAAKKLYDKLVRGEYYEAADGSWKQK